MKFFEIVKARWPEVLVVVCFQASCLFLIKDIGIINTQPEEYSFRVFLLGVGLAAFSIISQMMLWGFLRTTAVSGTSAVQPGTLLVVGREYFWKLFVVQIILWFALAVIASVQQVTVSYILYKKFIPDVIPSWLEIIPVIIGGIILIKPIYFMPAIMLVGDLNMIEAFRYLRQLDLFRMGRFLPLAVGITVLTGAVEFLSASVHRTNIFFYPVSILQAVVIAGGLFVIFLSAVIELCKLKPKSPEKESENEQADI